LTSNIMSLGGIAIAIGAMVDAAIIMVENAHKSLERWNEERQSDDPVVRSHALSLSRFDVIVAAAKQVGRPLFFSLLVITVSFIPVFSLQAIDRISAFGSDLAANEQDHQDWHE